MDAKEFLKRVSEASGVSGYEDEIRDILVEAFGEFADEVRIDALGNVIAVKRGDASSQEERHKIMLAAHMDEIGLMVTKLDDGFLRFTSVGGFDRRTALGQEVVVHGRRPLPGVVASRPPHVLPAEERDVVPETHEMFIDVGLPPADVKDLVRVGDLVSVQREFTELHDGRVAGKAFDNRASVTVIQACLELLETRRHRWDVYAVATVQEEVGLQGALTSTYGISPDVGIALDVTLGIMPGVSEGEAAELGKGPTIAYGPNFHPVLFEKLVETAKSREIQYQIEPIPGWSGTDAWVMQVTKAGIPTALISVPLRYMHSSVELLSLQDVDRAGRLLADFIAALDQNFLSSLERD